MYISLHCIYSLLKLLLQIWINQHINYDVYIMDEVIPRVKFTSYTLLHIYFYLELCISTLWYWYFYLSKYSEYLHH